MAPSSPATRVERGAQLVQAGTRDAADRDDRRAGHELARLLERELERLRVDGVGLRHRDDAALDAEEPEDRKVLVRLRPRALRRVDTSRKRSIPVAPGDHRPHEPLVARDVDERQRRPLGSSSGA